MLLTAQNRRLLRYLVRRVLEGHETPSVREVMRAMGWKSTYVAHKAIESLVRSGYVGRIGYGERRPWRLLGVVTQIDTGPGGDALRAFLRS